MSTEKAPLPPPPEAEAEKEQVQHDETTIAVRQEEEEEVTYAGPAGMPQKQAQQQGKEESGSSHVAKALAAQLGSSPRLLQKAKIDERKMAVLNDETATALGYFAYRGKVDKVRFFNWISNWELISSQAIGGLARRHILQAIAASSGVTVAEVANKPNVLARNISNRNWKEKAVQNGKVVIDE